MQKETVIMVRCISIVLLIAGVIMPMAASANSLDLTAGGSSGEINGAWFFQQDPQTTGTGVIQSFLRIQKNGVEEGYNTDYSRFQFDQKGGAFTHSLKLSDVPVVSLGGTSYRKFGLDINETSGSSQSFLSLDSMQIFLGSAGDMRGYPTGLGTRIYDLDAGEDSWLKLDYSLGHGSGSGDMYAYIPSALFIGPDQYVYLYSKFGLQGTKTNGMESSGGFEEWFVEKGSYTMMAVPEPGSMMIVVIGILPMAAGSLRRRK